MKGILLCGGLGTRLGQLTRGVVNKHILPVFDKPMCLYPLETLKKIGIKEVAVVVASETAHQFISLLKDGRDFGFDNISYYFQSKNDGGIADALSLTERFANGESVAVILGDNSMDVDQNFLDKIQSFQSGACIFLKEVSHPEEFGCPKFENDRIIDIIEKPQDPPSNYAVIGFYLYDNKIYDCIKQCKPSARNQLEISDCNNLYLQHNELDYQIIDFFWQDAGTFDNLFLANKYWFEKHHGYDK